MDFSAYWQPARRFRFRGADVAYLDLGRGPALVFLHGHSGRLADWRPQIDFFSARYRVIAPDLPGHGLSDIPRNHRMSHLVASIEALMDHLELRSGVAFGHSMGGRVALHLALRSPSRIGSVVLANAPADQPLPASLRALSRWLPIGLQSRAMRFRPTMKTLFGRYSKGLVAVRTPTIEEKLEWIRWSRNQPEFPARVDYLLRLGRNVIRDRIVERLAEIPQPTLLIWGRRDPTSPASSAQRLLEGLQDAKIVWIEEASHSPQLELPELTNEVILKFLERKERG